MKIYKYAIVGLAITLGSCTNNNKNENAESVATNIPEQAKEDAKMPSEFHLAQLPVSTKDIGTFPYLTAPKDYKYTGSIEKKLEEKYFFYSDSLVKVIKGKYFHTSILPASNIFEDTFVIAEYAKMIDNMGGVVIYTGTIPNEASKMIDKHKPAYVDDMYDPRPYKYKQFLIRTPVKNIWIELCHGLNANQIDLTVLEEETQNNP